MKKYLMLLLAATLFVACNDDEPEVNPGKQDEKIIDFPDYAEAVGLTYDNMLKKYGEPTMAFGGYYAFDATDTTKVSSVIMMVNTQLQQVYGVMETLVEGAYTEDQLKAYFSSKYTYYGTEDEVDKMLTTKANVEDDDAEAEGTQALVYGNDKDVNKATILIGLYGSSQVVYTNPALVPEQPEGPDMSTLNPASAVAKYMGASLDVLKEDFGDALYMIDENSYLISLEDNQWLMAMAFYLTDGVVKQMSLLYNEDLTDEDIIAYYQELGYTATPCGADEQTGKEVYLFMNMATGDMFTYSDCRATFMDLSDMGDDEDYGDED